MDKSPLLPPDDDARATARELLRTARSAVLAVCTGEGRAPLQSRIAFALGPGGDCLSLISSLAQHHQALKDTPVCSLLIGDPPDKGDALAFPRITLTARAEFLPRSAHAELRGPYLERHPKARLYVDFADFGFVRFLPDSAFLNAGFGKAFNLSPDDLA